MAAALLVGCFALGGVARGHDRGAGRATGWARRSPRAAPGDTLRLAAGVHRGSVVIGTPGLTLEGEPGAVIDGLRQGRTHG